MPIQTPFDPDYNFSRTYETLPRINLPLKITKEYQQENAASTTYGLEPLTAYTNELDRITVSPDFGTPFAGTSLSDIIATDFIDNFRYFIDFGDGTIASDLSATHYYKYPGEYVISIVAADSATNFYIGAQQPAIKAVNAVPDKIFLTYKDNYEVNSSSFGEPLYLTRWNSYQSYPSLSSIGYSINLTCSGNRSPLVSRDDYYNDIDAHFKQFSAFVKIDPTTRDYEVINDLTTTNTEVYGERNPLFPGAGLPYILYGYPKQGSIFLGTSGFAEFFYYED